jgi:hypothetical protein
MPQNQTKGSPASLDTMFGTTAVGTVVCPCSMGAPGGPGSNGFSPDEAIVCACICACNENFKYSASGARLRQQCVTKTLWGYDDATGNQSTIKAEVPYRMVPPPPRPIMSANNPKRATRSKPAGSRIPDVVIVKDGSQRPTQANIAEIIEIKFPGDSYSDGQFKDYQKIAGLDAEVKTFGVEECGCNKPEPQKVPVVVPQPQQESEASKNAKRSGILVGLGVLAGVLAKATGAAIEEYGAYLLGLAF